MVDKRNPVLSWGSGIGRCPKWDKQPSKLFLSNSLSLRCLLSGVCLTHRLWIGLWASGRDCTINIKMGVITSVVSKGELGLWSHSAWILLKASVDWQAGWPFPSLPAFSREHGACGLSFLISHLKRKKKALSDLVLSFISVWDRDRLLFYFSGLGRFQFLPSK